MLVLVDETVALVFRSMSVVVGVGAGGATCCWALVLFVSVSVV